MLSCKLMLASNIFVIIERNLKYMTVEELQKRAQDKPGFISLVGINFLEVSLGFCKGELIVREELANPYGMVHGGCIFTLADTIGGSAALTHGKPIVTVDSNIHYLSPAVNTTKLIAEAKEIKYGSKIAVYEVNIMNDTGDLLATSTMSYFIMEEN